MRSNSPVGPGREGRPHVDGAPLRVVPVLPPALPRLAHRLGRLHDRGAQAPPGGQQILRARTTGLSTCRVQYRSPGRS
jgi:hypothetical protein